MGTTRPFTPRTRDALMITFGVVPSTFEKSHTGSAPITTHHQLDIQHRQQRSTPERVPGVSPKWAVPEGNGFVPILVVLISVPTRFFFVCVSFHVFVVLANRFTPKSFGPCSHEDRLGGKEAPRDGLRRRAEAIRGGEAGRRVGESREGSDSEGADHHGPRARVRGQTQPSSTSASLPVTEEGFLSVGLVRRSST